MDSLVAIGTLAAFSYSLYTTFKIATTDMVAGHGHHQLYYESAGIIITLILLGKYLESRSKGKTSEVIKKLMGFQPKTAIVVKNGKEIGILIAAAMSLSSVSVIANALRLKKFKAYK